MQKITFFHSYEIGYRENETKSYGNIFMFHFSRNTLNIYC